MSPQKLYNADTNVIRLSQTIRPAD